MAQHLISQPTPPTPTAPPAELYGAAPLDPADPTALGRGLNRRWKWRRGRPANAADLLSRVLGARDLTDPGESARFLEPKLSHLHDPSLIPDLDKAAARILAAARGGEPIVIYGDYDVDGVTATAILWHILRSIVPSADVRTYVPHRLEEGYGLNTAAVQSLAAGGAKLIVTVDCGVTAHEPALAARRAGVDLIITDHHNPPASAEALPVAYAIVHPRRPDSAYPFDHLCGAGVAFKLAWRLATLASDGGPGGPGKVSESLRGLLVNLLAFAALGAIADVVPLTGENRVIARFGLERIRTSPVAGLRALVEAARLDTDKVSTWDVGFKLAPRLNASGRMAHAAQAVELFTTADANRAREIAEALETANAKRKAVEREIFESAVAAAEAAGQTGPEHRAIVLSDPAWHKGVVGIVCSRLVERFARPVLLLQTEGELCHGSGRSVDGFNLHGALERCAHLLDRFGGHDMAAGMCVRADKLQEFTRAFAAEANRLIAPSDLIHTLRIDSPADIGELSLQAVRTLELLDPCGRGNPAVTLLLEDARLETVQPLGAKGEHLSLVLRHAAPPPAAGLGRALRIVGWRWGHLRPHLAPGQRMDAVIKVCLNTYNDTTTVQGELEDLRLRPAE